MEVVGERERGAEGGEGESGWIFEISVDLAEKTLVYDIFSSSAPNVKHIKDTYESIQPSVTMSEIVQRIKQLKDTNRASFSRQLRSLITDQPLPEEQDINGGFTPTDSDTSESGTATVSR